MVFEDLQGRLLQRVQRQLSSPPIDPEQLVDSLEHARSEYNRFSPRVEVFEFYLADGDEHVAILNPDNSPVEVFSCFGVYGKFTGPVSDPFGFVNQGASMPSNAFFNARYRDAYKHELLYYRNHHEFIITRPSVNVREVEGVIVYGTGHTWAQLPALDEKILLDRALAEWLDNVLVQGSAGLVRIPTPHGSFEFDGGRILLSLRDKLIEGFESKLFSRLTFTGQG